jgi:hypothetical protein
VYLFSIDLERVYACLAFGVTAFEESFGKNRIMLGRLDSKALCLASRLRLGSRFSSGSIDLGTDRPTQLHGLYEHSSIASVRYDLTDLPNNEVLQRDLLQLLDWYDQLRREVGADVDEEASLESVVIEASGLMEEVLFAPAALGRDGSGNSDQRRWSKASKKIGDAGERRVVEHEQERLTLAGRPDLEGGPMACRRGRTTRL